MATSRLAVTGMGRSGVGVARAAARRGYAVTLFDERLIETSEQITMAESLQALGVDVLSGWHGRFEDPKFEILVTSPGFKRDHPALRDAVERGCEVLSEVEFAYRIARGPIVAVTGTNGKSTTNVLAWSIIGACAPALLCGNVSGSGYPELTLCEAADQGCEQTVLVAEVSSYQLEWVTRFRPRVAAITNITPDHFDRHPDFSDYQQTKLRIFARQGVGDAAVVNANEPSLPLDFILPHVRSDTEVIKFNESSSTTRVEGQNLYLSGVGALDLSRFNVFGLHNLVNLGMAWEMARFVLGAAADPARMLDGLVTYRGLEHRMEVIGSVRGVTLVNNSMCTNPAALVASSESVPGRQHLLVGGLTKELDFAPVREFFARTSHSVYLFGPRLPNSLHDQLPEVPVYPDLKSAFESAMDSAVEGETVLLCPGCASAPPYGNFRERGEDFKRLARQYLEVAE